MYWPILNLENLNVLVKTLDSILFFLINIFLFIFDEIIIKFIMNIN